MGFNATASISGNEVNSVSGYGGLSFSATMNSLNNLNVGINNSRRKRRVLFTQQQVYHFFKIYFSLIK